MNLAKINLEIGEADNGYLLHGFYYDANGDWQEKYFVVTNVQSLLEFVSEIILEVINGPANEE